MDRDRPTVFTIGHSNHPPDRLLELLAQHRIELLVDVRSYPASRYAPHFDRRALERAVLGAGRDYLFLGRELGGRPVGDELYDADGRVDYARVATSGPFERGMRRLADLAGGRRVALLCSEEDPLGCHRRLLIGRVLGERGVDVAHIRGDGAVEREAELAARAARGRREGGQLALFPESACEGAWKSTRSVSRARARPSSSGR